MIDKHIEGPACQKLFLFVCKYKTIFEFSFVTLEFDPVIVSNYQREIQ